MDLSAYSDNDQELLLSWLSVIGMMTMYWSPVERTIDQCVHLLHISNEKKPLTLNRKLEFISKKLSKDIASSDDLESLIKLTKTTVKIRDICVHGVLEFYDQDQIKISKVDGKKAEHVREIFTIDRNRLDKSAKNLTILSKEWKAIANILFNGTLND